VPKLTRQRRRSPNRDRQCELSTVKNVTITRAPKDLASLIRGLYGRVASQLGVDPSYVSRVARSERYSKTVEDALRRELNKIIKNFGKRRGRFPRAAGKISAKKEMKKKATPKPT
jgi:hypothetical protein